MSRLGKKYGKTPQGEATKNRIFEETRKLIATCGWTGFTVRDVTDASDVSSGDLYNHWPGGLPEVKEAALTDAIHCVPNWKHDELKRFLDAMDINECILMAYKFGRNAKGRART
jgi:AcrR family transcriptional regulator